jgi:hypothetical protein
MLASFPLHIKLVPVARQLGPCKLTFDEFFTIHRHFQVLSFKDPWFAYTKLSCLSVARKSLQGIFSMPNDEHAWIARSMWTVNTQVVTAAIGIMFEILFVSDENESISNRTEMRELVQNCVNFLRKMQGRSTIAAKGVRLIDFLLNLDLDRTNGLRKQFEIGDIISYVKGNSNTEPVTAFDMPVMGSPYPIDWLSPGVNTWEGLLDSTEFANFVD